MPKSRKIGAGWIATRGWLGGEDVRGGDDGARAHASSKTETKLPSTWPRPFRNAQREEAFSILRKMTDKKFV